MTQRGTNIPPPGAKRGVCFECTRNTEYPEARRCRSCAQAIINIIDREFEKQARTAQNSNK